MILFLHNRYRTKGGEERVVDDLLSLVRRGLGEDAELLSRDSAALGRTTAALGLLGGGSRPSEVAGAVRLTGARVVHAHNLLPTLGWRALAAARRAGAGVVLHLHQYRLVCANGVCFTQGQECTRCHGRNTLPGIVLGCRGSRAEGLAYGGALALWQRRLADQADAVIVPSEFARERLRALGAPLDFERVHVLAPPVHLPTPASGGAGAYALVVSRLAPEKGVDVAVAACRRVGVPLIVAGDGPERAKLEDLAQGTDVRFLGHVEDETLRDLRARAMLALVPSRSAETFGLAAAEAMAAGVPVIASSVGALPELVEAQALVPPGDAEALAQAIQRRRNDVEAGKRGRRRVEQVCSPAVLAPRLAEVYERASRRRP